MTLSDTRSHYIEIRDALLTLLRNNVTELNQNLESPILDAEKQITKGSPELLPNYSSIMPYIFIAFTNIAEAYQSQGIRKNTTFQLTIYVITRLIKETGYDDDDEKIRLVDNIQSILRKKSNIQFSNYIRYHDIPNIDIAYGAEIGEGIYVSGASITIDIFQEVI